MLAVGVVQIGVDAGNVDNFAGVVLKGHIDDGLKDALHFLGDVLVAVWPGLRQRAPHSVVPSGQPPQQTGPMPSASSEQSG